MQHAPWTHGDVNEHGKEHEKKNGWRVRGTGSEIRRPTELVGSVTAPKLHRAGCDAPVFSSMRGRGGLKALASSLKEPPVERASDAGPGSGGAGWLTFGQDGNRPLGAGRRLPASTPQVQLHEKTPS